MLSRIIQTHIETQLSRYPAVFLHGPRSCGKTTLAQAVSSFYFDLENPKDIQRLEIEWASLMHRKELIALDEVHTNPEFYLRLRAVIDEDRARNGRFLLIDSVDSPLTKPLAACATICELPPLLARECDEKDWDDLWKFGGYPDGSLPGWHQTYLERMAQLDLPNWGFPARPRAAHRFFRMLAAQHGQVWNASRIAKSLGVSYHTVNTYVTFLERAFLARKLSPYISSDIKKRMARTPKVFWRDTGLLHTLMNFRQDDDLFAQIWAGSSWEGWIIEQILSHLYTAGHSVRAFHFGTSDGYTLDLVLRHRNRIWAFNISISSSPEIEVLKRLKKTSEMIGAHQAILVCRTEEAMEHEGVVSLNLGDALDRLLA